MNEKKREKFLAWHAGKVLEQAVFNFQEKLLRYCESDVKLLKEGCLKFFQEFEEIAPQLKAFLSELEMIPPLKPRDAFYGGRTGAVHLRCKVQDPDIINYSDVKSLYPWVNKY